MQVTDVCKKVWDSIYNVHNSCPDVEVGYIENVLVNIVEENVYHNIENKTERHLLAKLSVIGNKSKQVLIDEILFNADHNLDYTCDLKTLRKKDKIMTNDFNKACENLLKLGLLKEEDGELILCK